MAHGHSRHGTELRRSRPGRPGDSPRPLPLAPHPPAQRRRHRCRPLLHPHQRPVAVVASFVAYHAHATGPQAAAGPSRTQRSGTTPGRACSSSSSAGCSPQDFGTGPGQVSVDEKVPTTLYLPDGRTVPVCVVQVDPAEPARDPVPAWVWPERVIGGGLPVITRSQGEEHVASVGTLVTDGHTVYALTARHVCGPVGTPVSTRLRQREVEVGQASEHQLTRVPFDVVYPDLVCHRTYLTLDAGLVEVDEVADWSSQTYGLPPAGPFADLSEHNLTTKLVNAEVVAFGAASGYLRGRIAALLFRYRSIGGYDDITDFLIAPGPGQRGSQPGDSGSVWHLSQTADDGTVQLLPIALQWGGENLVGSTPGTLQLRARLQPDQRAAPARRQSRRRPQHAGPAVLGKDRPLHDRQPRLRAPQDVAAEDADAQQPGPDRLPAVGARPRRHRRGHHQAEPEPDASSRSPTSPTWSGRTSRPRSSAAATRRHRRARSTPPTTPTSTSRAPRTARPCASSAWRTPRWSTSRPGRSSTPRSVTPIPPTVACCPSGSGSSSTRWSTPPPPVTRPGSSARPGWSRTTSETPHSPCTGPTSRTACRPRRPPRPTGQGVHSAYETAMVDAFSTEILAGLQATLTHRGAEQGPILTGHDAAVAVVRLMDRTAKTLKPIDLIAVFAQTQVGKTTHGPDGDPGRPRDPVGPRRRATVKVMADGTRTLAAIWEAAFTQGKGVSTIPTANTQGRRPGSPAGALPGPRLRAVPRPRPHRLGAEQPPA